MNYSRSDGHPHGSPPGYCCSSLAGYNVFFFIFGYIGYEVPGLLKLFILHWETEQDSPILRCHQRRLESVVLFDASEDPILLMNLATL